MEIIKHTTGRIAGSISVLNTIETMKIGDVWIADPSEVKVSTIYVTCWKYSILHNTVFTVSMKENEHKITIRRVS